MTEKKGNWEQLPVLSRVLGIFSFLVFISVVILDGLEWFSMQWELALLLFMTFLVLLGFGNRVENILENL